MGLRVDAAGDRACSPVMSLVASSAPVAASRTVTVHGGELAGAGAVGERHRLPRGAADRVVATLVAQVDRARLGAGAEAGARRVPPAGIRTVKISPGSPRPTTHDPS